MMYSRERFKTEPSSPRLRNSSIPAPRTPTKKKFINVQTNTEEYRCQKCLELEKLESSTELDADLKENYLKSIKYINSCHAMMNELLHKTNKVENWTSSTESLTNLMPDLPNFLGMYSFLQKCLNDSQPLSSGETSSSNSNTKIIGIQEATQKIENYENFNINEEKKEEIAIKTKGSFIKLSPEIKKSEDLKSNTEKLNNSDAESVSNESATTKKKLNSRTNSRSQLLRPRSAEQKARQIQNNTATATKKDKSKSAQDIKPQKLEAKPKNKIQKSQSVDENQEVVQRAVDYCGDSKSDDLIEKYAKELLESTINDSFQFHSNLETNKKISATNSSHKKVKFADQMNTVVEENSATKLQSKIKENRSSCNIKTQENIKEKRNGVKNEPKPQNFMPGSSSAPNFSGNPMFYAPGNFSIPDQQVFYQSLNPNYFLQNQLAFNAAAQRYSALPANTNPNFYLMMAQNQNLARMQQMGNFGQRMQQNLNANLEKLNQVESIILDDTEYEKDFENSDTDYIPSDSDIEMNVKTQIKKSQPNPESGIGSNSNLSASNFLHRQTESFNRPSNPQPSHPLNLNERSLHLLDPDMVSNMGVFRSDGYLTQEMIQKLEDVKNYRSTDSRNKPFRSSRSENSSDISEDAAEEILKLDDRSSDASSSLDEDDKQDDLSSSKAKINLNSHKSSSSSKSRF